MTELVERLRAAQSGVQLHSNIPVGYITTKLEELIEVRWHIKLLVQTSDLCSLQLESQARSREKVIGDRSREMRAIEALILSKTRNTKPGTFEHIDLLYSEAHDQVVG